MLHVVKTVAELRQEAKEKSIRGYSKMKKHELREALGYTPFNYEDRYNEHRSGEAVFPEIRDYQREIEDIIKRNEKEMEEIQKQTKEAVRQADDAIKRSQETIRQADDAIKRSHEISKETQETIRRSREARIGTREIRRSEEAHVEAQEVLRRGNELLKNLEEKREKEKINREKKLERELENLEVCEGVGEGENINIEGNNANLEDEGVVKGESDGKGKSGNKEDGDREKEKCKACFYYKRSHICAPCGHMVFCAKCAYDYEKSTGSNPVCPVCKEKVTSFIKVYMP